MNPRFLELSEPWPPFPATPPHPRRREFQWEGAKPCVCESAGALGVVPEGLLFI